MKVQRQKINVIRLNGQLHEVIKSYDYKGKLIHTRTKPMHVEFQIRDVMQVIIGASILAVPVGFTEETWKLGSYLPWSNVLGLLALSISFVAFFVYYDSYRYHLKHYVPDYITRVLFTYIFVFLVVSAILTIIRVAPWQTDLMLAVKRVIIVSFPASMSAAITDTLK